MSARGPRRPSTQAAGPLATGELVVVRREGRQRWNYLNPMPIEKICGRWINAQVRHLSAAVNRLQELAAEPNPS